MCPRTPVYNRVGPCTCELIDAQHFCLRELQRWGTHTECIADGSTSAANVLCSFTISPSWMAAARRLWAVRRMSGRIRPGTERREGQADGKSDLRNILLLNMDRCPEKKIIIWIQSVYLFLSYYCNAQRWQKRPRCYLLGYPYHVWV